MNGISRAAAILIYSVALFAPASFAEYHEAPVKVIELQAIPISNLPKLKKRLLQEATVENDTPQTADDGIATSANAPKPLGYVVGDRMETPEPFHEYSWTGQEYPAFDRPGGERVGTFIVSVGLDLCLDFPSYRGTRVRAGKDETIAIAKCRLYYYYEQQGGFVRVLTRSVPEGLWIPLHYRLPQNSGMRVSFGLQGMLDGLMRVSAFQIGNFSGYVLRDRPSAAGGAIEVLESGKHAIAGFTGKQSGLWAEAEVYEISEYPDEPCYSRGDLETVKVKSFKGWIKVLEDDGLPGKLSWGTIC